MSRANRPFSLTRAVLITWGRTEPVLMSIRVRACSSLGLARTVLALGMPVLGLTTISAAVATAQSGAALAIGAKGAVGKTAGSRVLLENSHCALELDARTGEIVALKPGPASLKGAWFEVVEEDRTGMLP